MFKAIKKWFSKKPYTKASILIALGTLLLAVFAFSDQILAWLQFEYAQDLAEKADAEIVLVQLHGGRVCEDVRTQFGTTDSRLTGIKKVITSYWPVVVSNNGQSTISIVDHEAYSWIHGAKRNIETILYDKKFVATALPVSIEGGVSVKLYLAVPIHVPNTVYSLIEDVPAFSGAFTIRELNNYMRKNHSIDFYGNEFLPVKDPNGEVVEGWGGYFFKLDEDNTLLNSGMQADQVTLTLKTARGNYFSSRALYYDSPAFRPRPVIEHPAGKGATILFKPEPIDKLPKEKDAKVETE